MLYMLHAGLCLHQPHSAARGSGEVACQPGGAPAAPPHADHLRHQLALPARPALSALGEDWDKISRMSIIEEAQRREVSLPHTVTLHAYWTSADPLSAQCLASRCCLSLLLA